MSSSSTSSSSSSLPGLDPLFLAWSRHRRGRFESASSLCTEILSRDPYDQAVWLQKCRAETAQLWTDDVLEADDAEIAAAAQESATSQNPRPGTSFARPATSSSSGGPQSASGASARPTSRSGRPITGYARPPSSAGAAAALSAASSGGEFRPTTSRPVTSGGRFVFRPLTASLAALSSQGGGSSFVNIDKLDLAKYSKHGALAKSLFEYIWYHEDNPKKALELAALSTVEASYKDWWWKAALGRCYLRLGMFRDAEKQFKSALAIVDTVGVRMDLARAFLCEDSPALALETYRQGSITHVGDPHLVLGVARLLDTLRPDESIDIFRKALDLDSSNVEALSCLATHYFYADQPELSMRLYRRLLLMGLSYSAALWCNLGLSCFYSNQIDMALHCMERALWAADEEDDDSVRGDIWFNLSQISIGIGDLSLAYSCLKISIAADPENAEAFNDMGCLEMRKANLEAAKADFETAAVLAPRMHEPHFNAALLASRAGDMQTAHQMIRKAAMARPASYDTLEMLNMIERELSAV